jgi:hypothetical protein
VDARGRNMDATAAWPNGGTCDPASDETVGVPYTAVYRFFSDGE